MIVAMTNTWLTGVFDASVRGGIALLAAWTFSIIPNVPAAIKCWTWQAAYLVLIVAFFWTTPIDLPIERLPNPPSIDEVVRPENVAATHTEDLPTITVGLRSPVRPIWSRVAFVCWLGFLLIYLVRLTLRWRQTRILHHGESIWVPELAPLCQAIFVRTPVVRTHPTVRGPLLIGLLKPTIVLPALLIESADRRLVIAHELAHLKRQDLQWNWLPILATALLPVYPIVWIANRRWRLAVEEACDAEAIRSADTNAADYGRLIVSIATTPPVAGILSVAATTDSKWILTRRLHAMKVRSTWSRFRRICVGGLVATIGGIGVVPWHVVSQAAPLSIASSTSSAPSTAPTEADSTEVLAFVGELVATRADIRVQTTGMITDVPVSEGQTVKTGQSLVTFDTSQVQGKLQRAIDNANQVLEHSKMVDAMVKSGVASVEERPKIQQELRNANDRMSDLRDELIAYKCQAPFDGTVTNITAQANVVVAAGQQIATVIQTGKLRATAAVPQSDVGRVTVGTAVQVRCLNLDSGSLGQIAKGTIRAIAPALDPATRTQQITVELTSDEKGLLPGMLCQVIIPFSRPHTPSPAQNLSTSPPTSSESTH